MDMTRQDVRLFSTLKFTRFNSENKLHFPCIQYVTTKVTIFMENAKHLTYAVLLQIQISV